MHSLNFEKVIDKIGSKYEAVTLMSVIAKKISDGDATVDLAANEKVTTAALRVYLQEKEKSPQPGTED